MVVFLLYLLNLILIWLVKGKLYVVLLLLAALGFGVSVFIDVPRGVRSLEKVEEATEATKGTAKATKKEEPHSMVFEPASSTAVPAAVTTFKPVKTFSPGKFVASIQSNQFHAPACDWAKKIQKQRRVWFRDMDEAFEKGYRKHSCLK